MTEIPHFLEAVSEYMSVANEIAAAAFGKVNGAQNTSTSEKEHDNNQVLTQTDLDIGQSIIALIRTQFPTHNIIDEEAGVIDNGSQYTWVIDPIDGTSNFANGVPTFGTMVGLLEDDQPIVGGLTLPAFNEIYIAGKGQGARCNGRPLSVTTNPKLLSTLVAYGIDGHQEQPELTIEESKTLAQIILGIRNLRSSNSVFDIAMVVQGSYGAALNRTSKIWDNVAQQVLVEEAGGRYTDFFGQPMDYAQPLKRSQENYTYCAAAPHLHQQLQTLIHHG
jgi:myo-inositol-1(or 4)-monophosphatase